MNLDELSFTKARNKKMKNPKHDAYIIQMISLVEQFIEVKRTKQTIAILKQYSKCEQAKTNQII
jgi:hypothetical protein